MAVILTTFCGCIVYVDDYIAVRICCTLAKGFETKKSSKWDIKFKGQLQLKFFISYDIFTRKSRFLLSIFGKIKELKKVNKNRVPRSWHSARSIT